MNAFIKLFALAMALSQTYGQLAITNGGFAVKFPTKDWTREEPPAALRDAINQHGKLLLYAESSNGKFFVSQFDYPPAGNQVGFIAGFLGGVRKSSAQRGMVIEEEFGTFRGGPWPTYTYSHKVQDNFVHTTAIFCAERLYNVQIVGPDSWRAEAIKTLDGVTIRDAPMAAATFEKARKPNAIARNTAYELGRQFGFVFGIIIVIAICFGITALVRRLSGSGKRPPPLPPSARVNP